MKAINKLNYIVKHQTDFNKAYDLLELLLTSAGVQDVQHFLNTKESDTHDSMLFNNITKALELFKSCAIGENKKVFVKVDSDVDGFTSSAYIIQFIKSISPTTEVLFDISFNKTHGIYYKDVKDIENLNLIIVPDAGSDSIEECKRISEMKNVPILILDHHEFNNLDIHNYATVVNCTDGHYPNRNLSGVGVVHKFCLAYCKENNIPLEKANRYLDLVALGMIADNIDLRDYEARYYVIKGLSEDNQNNSFIKEMILRFENEFSLGNTINNFGWTIAPNINAMVRYGTKTEQYDTIRALIGEKEDREYQPRRPRGSDKNSEKPPIEIHSLQKTMARVCCNAKGRQDSKVKKYLETFIDKITAEHLDDNSIIVVDGTDIMDEHTVTGMLANKLAFHYKRPTLVLNRKDENNYGGSGRGYGKGEIANFKDFLTELKLFNKVAGHPNAFGIDINQNNISKVIEECNKRINVTDLVQVYEVDFEIEAHRLKVESVCSVAEHYDIWGNGIEEPRFAITNLIIPACEIKGVQREGSDYVGFISFTYNGIKFIKKYCKKEDFFNMTARDRKTLGKNRKTINLTLIASFELEEYDGIKKPVVVIKDFESNECKDADTPYIQDNYEDKIVNKKKVYEDDFIF